MVFFMLRGGINMKIKQITLAALFITIGLVLPLITFNIPTIGSMLLPMHIPVLLAGFVCGGPVALLVGFITPILRSLIFSMPMMYPTAIAMAFELATYGLIAGLIFSKSKKNMLSIYLSLIISMIIGRIVWGLICIILFGIAGNTFTISIFIAGALTNAIPGIILQIILIPIIVRMLQKGKLI